MTTSARGRHRKLRRNILHTVVATALLAGTFTVVDQTVSPQEAVAAPSDAGSPDLTFNANVGTSVGFATTAVVVDSSDRTYVATAGGGIKRYSSNGTLDTTFTNAANAVFGSNSTINALAIDGAGNIFAAIGSTGIKAVNSNGASIAFNSGAGVTGSGTNNVNGVAAQTINAISLVFSGTAAATKVIVGTSTAPYLRSLTSAGALDGIASATTGFNYNVGSSTVTAPVYALGIDSTGGIIVGGDSPTQLRRYSSTGVPDSTFTSNVGNMISGSIRAIRFLSDGTMIAAGTGTNNISKLSATGVVDTNFRTSAAPFDGDIKALTVLPGNSIVVGGAFTEKIALLSSSGSQDSSFDSNVSTAINGTVNALAKMAYGGLRIGGAFTNYLFGTMFSVGDTYCLSSGTPSKLVDGVYAVSGATEMTSTGSLVQNGNFDSITPATNEVKFGPAAPSTTISNWNITGGGTSTYSHWTNATPTASSVRTGDSLADATPGRLYFGNQGLVGSTGWDGTWTNPIGWTTKSLTLSAGAAYGGTNGIGVNQSISTIPGRVYRLQFFVGHENSYTNDGIAGLKLTGYQQLYFRVQTTGQGELYSGAGTRYTVDFTARDYSTNLSFVNWGHTSNGTEMVLDTVRAVECASPGPRNNPDETSGAVGQTQTINLLTNTLGPDFPSGSATWNAATLLLCDPTTTPAETPNSCTKTTVTVPGVGTYSVNTAGQMSFTPEANFFGTPAPLDYMITDSAGKIGSSSYTPTVKAPTYPAGSPSYCTTSGIPNQLATNLFAMTSAAEVNASSSNLVQNGDFATAGSLTNGKIVGGGRADRTAIPNWIATGGRADTGNSASWYNVANAYTYDPSVNANLARISTSNYPITAIKNAANTTLSWSTERNSAFNSSGWSTNTYTITTGSTLPIAFEQTITTVPNRVYRLQFFAGHDTSFANGGIAGLSLTGYQQLYFSVSAGSQAAAPGTRYTVDFLATSASTTIKFQNWGRADTTSTELVLDSVSLNPCAPGPKPLPDATSGIMGATQTINLLSNATSTDIAAEGSTLDATSVKLCASNETPTGCAQTSVTIAGKGTYSVNSSGLMTFTPEPTYVGTAPPIPYTVTDSNGYVGTSTYTATVTPPPMTANPDTTSGLKGATQTINLTTNDVASSGATVTASSVKLCNVSANPAEVAPNCTVPSGTPVVVAGVGSYVVNSSGVMTFTPLANYIGTPAALPYVVADSANSVGTSTYTPTVFGTPTATPDAITDAWDTNQIYNPVTNDIAGSGTTLTASSVRICATGTAAASCVGTTLTVANQGTYTVDTTTGAVTFDPLPTFTGTATPIQYVVTDSQNQKVTSTITPTVNTPPAPTATPDTITSNYDVTQNYTPLSNDTANTSFPLLANSVKLCASNETPNNCTQTTLTVANEGTYTVNPTTGAVEFNPLPTFTGTATPVKYQAKDSLNRFVDSTISPIIGAPPAPTTVADAQTTAYDVTQTYTPTSNDSANVNFPLNVTTVKLCKPATTNPPVSAEVSPNCTLTLLTTADGVYTVNTTTGAVEFDPAPTFSGTVASPISYQVTDSINRTASATITPTIGAPPAPSASPNTSTGAFDTNQTINPLTNDTANANFPLSPTSVKLCGTNPVETPNNCTKTVLVIAGEGTYTVDPTTGVVTFDPLSTFAGTATAIKYQATDSLGRFIDSTIAATVDNPPLPVANPNTSYGAKNATQVFNPLGDDTVSTGFPLDPTSVKLCGTNPVETPNNCTKTSLVIDGKGAFTVDPTTGYVTFTPVTDYIGTVPTISYVVTDSLGRKANSTIDVVVASDPAMAATLDTSSGNYNTPQTINPLTNDSAGRTLGITGFTTIGTVSIDTASVRFCGPGQFQPNCNQTTITNAAGTYTVNTTTGVVTFTPAATFTGTDVNGPTYQVCNTIGSGWDPVPASTCATAQIVPTVGAPPVPVANTDADTTAYDTNKTVNPLNNDTVNSNFPLNATTVKLCGAGQTPNGSPACDKTTLEVLNQGTYTVNPLTGEVTFDPLPSFTGPATPITYQVTDSINRTVSSTIAVTVGTPPAPSATNDTKTGPYDDDQLISPLSNDSSTTAFPFDQTTVKLCGPDNLTTTGVNESVAPNCVAVSLTTADGEYTVNANGTVTFNPDADFTGLATVPVTYQVTDMLQRTASATITPTVGAPPVATAVPDAQTTAYDVNQTYTPTSNDTSNSNFPITASSVRLCGAGQVAPACDKTTLTTDDGVYTVNTSTGEVTFNPDADFTGLATQPVTYQAKDSLDRAISTTITPTVGAPPVATAVPDAQTTAYDVNQTYTPTSNDTSNSNFPITASSVRLCGAGQVAPACDKTTLTTDDGVYTVNTSTGEVTFNPDADFTGLATQPVTYQAKDSLDRAISTTITPTVGAPPVPTATANTTSGPYDANQTVNLLTNDSPGTPEFPMVASTVLLCGASQTSPACDKSSLVVANEGTYTVNPTTGIVTFDPLPIFTGQATAITYQAKDSLNRFVSSTYTPTVSAPPQMSIISDVSEDGWDVTQTKNVLSNDLPGSTSFPLLANSVKICGANEDFPNCTKTSVQIANEGTYTVNNDGTISFDPVQSFTGEATAILYQVSDGLNRSDAAYYTPTVTVPPAPAASPDTVALVAGATKVFSSIFDGTSGDTDPALATKGAGAPNLTNSTACLLTPGTTTCDADGVVTIAGEGTYTLDPATGIVSYASLSTASSGAKTPVTYQITDGLNRSVTSTLTPTIEPRPVANPDFTTGVQGAIQTISPVGNDNPGGQGSTELFPDTRAQVPSGVFLCAANQPPPDCAASTVTVTDPVSNATLGVLTVAATGLVTFTPEPNFVGTTPPIGYQIPDNLGQKAYSTITITVLPPPAPSAVIDTGSAEYNKPVTLRPWINDSAGAVPAGSSLPAPSLVATSIKLCDDNATFVAFSGTPADCTATKVRTVEGTYEVNATTGEVIFTPNPNMVDPITGLPTGKSFVGTVTYPPTYQIWNNWTGLGGVKSATALLVPTIAPPGAPAATVDITKTKPGTSVVLNPVSNDKPGTAALDPTTIRLCGVGEISPSCSQMSVTTLDGLYVVDPANGQVTFTPRDGFTGQATIPYVIMDGLGMMANANLIITVEETAVVPVVKKTKVGLAKTGGHRPDVLLLLGILAMVGAGGLRVASRKR